MRAAEPFEALLKKDRFLVLSGIFLITLVSWAYMWYLVGAAAHTGADAEMRIHGFTAWRPADFVTTFVMWAVMMVAMMAPSAAPAVLMFAAVRRRRAPARGFLDASGVFLLGYLGAWTWYSALATLGQWGLKSAALLSPAMGRTSPVLGGILLLVTGIFQFTPLKNACLTRCRSPLGFMLNEWREGTWGFLRMGLRMGNYCVVCCWALMALMFVVGVMSLLWMAVIAAVVLAEKIAPGGVWAARLFGVGFIAWGIWLLVTVPV